MFTRIFFSKYALPYIHMYFSSMVLLTIVLLMYDVDPCSCYLEMFMDGSLSIALNSGLVLSVHIVQKAISNTLLIH